MIRWRSQNRNVPLVVERQVIFGFNTDSKALMLNPDLNTTIAYKYLLDQATTTSGVQIRWVPLCVFLVVAVGAVILMRRTILGRHLYALGGNEQAGRILPALWDSAADRATRTSYVTLPPGGVLLLDGTLLLGRGLPFDLSALEDEGAFVNVDASNFGLLDRRLDWRSLGVTLPKAGDLAFRIAPCNVGRPVVLAFQEIECGKVEEKPPAGFQHTV